MFPGVIGRPDQFTYGIPHGWLRAEQEAAGVVVVAGCRTYPAAIFRAWFPVLVTGLRDHEPRETGAPGAVTGAGHMRLQRVRECQVK
jgi:hypothetical protein